jgi:hypothetical protein
MGATDAGDGAGTGGVEVGAASSSSSCASTVCGHIDRSVSVGVVLGKKERSREKGGRRNSNIAEINIYGIEYSPEDG